MFAGDKQGMSAGSAKAKRLPRISIRVCIYLPDVLPGKHRGVGPVLFKCWAAVCDGDPTLKQHPVNVVRFQVFSLRPPLIIFPCLKAFWFSPRIYSVYITGIIPYVLFWVFYSLSISIGITRIFFNCKICIA